MKLFCVSNIATYDLPLRLASMPVVKCDLNGGFLTCLYFIIYHYFIIYLYFVKRMSTWYYTCIYLCWINCVWVWVTHKCIIELSIIGSDNVLSPGRCQAIFWTNAGILLLHTLGVHLNEILIFLKENAVCKIAAISSRPHWGNWGPSQ